jgi:hypothetical protein
MTDKPLRMWVDLTRDEAKEHAHDLREGLGGDLAKKIADQIASQTPVPELPTKVGAVIESNTGQFFIRWAYDAHTHEPWIAAVDIATTWRTDDLPLITKVHFEGVDI